MAKKQHFQFLYVGPDSCQSELKPVGRAQTGVLLPGDTVVVDDVATAIWLRSLSSFVESESPTDKPVSHKKKQKPGPKPKAPASPPKESA